MNYNDKFLPFHPDFHELVLENISKDKIGKIHFFEPSMKVGLVEGKISKYTKKNSGYFLQVGSDLIRMDKIITLFGIPGPSYEDYDRYGNVCLTCEDLGQF